MHALSIATLGALTLYTSGAAAQSMQQSAHDHSTPTSYVATARPAGKDSAAVEGELARLRTVLAPYKDLDAAVRAGYVREAPSCVAHPTQGGMGFHHDNPSLMDDRLEPDHPEMLVFGRTADGTYRLNGIEYVVPYSAHARTLAPPTILGQPLRPADNLQLWYLHVWLWDENAKGVFAAWNPNVKC